MVLMKADIKASNIQNDKNFMYFDVSTKNKSEKPTKFKLPMLGIHNVRNYVYQLL